jgi:hypothetical protein
MKNSRASEKSTSMLIFQIEVFALQKLQLKHNNSGIHAAEGGIWIAKKES